MSKITNDVLTRSGAGCFIAVTYGNSGRQRVRKCASAHLSGSYRVGFEYVTT